MIFDRSKAVALLRKYGVVLLFAAIVGLTVTGAALPSQAAGQPGESTADAMNKVDAQVKEVLQLLEQNHVSKPNAEQLKDAAIRGMIQQLDDPYTQYFNAEEWKNFQNSLENNYVGIGVRVGEDSEGFYASEVFPNSPAAGQGLKRGDYITAVQGKSAKGMKVDDLTGAIKGKEGTSVTITVRSGTASREVTLQRKTIQIPIVTAKMIGRIGYLELSTFSENADELFAERLKELKMKGMTALVVDLRDNGGGYLDSATNIGKHFIQEGAFIHTKDRNGTDNPIHITNGEQLDVPVYMLVNGNSASASEVLTGALQDYKAAKVIGTKTFGKGSVQSLVPLSTGGVLKVTIQEYLTPKQHKVNKVGITPDIEVKGDAAQLLTALNSAGLASLDVAMDSKALTVNGVDFPDTFPVLSEQNKLYVPSRVLAAIVQGQLTWNGSTRGLDIASGAIKKTFVTESDGLKTAKDGTTYIDLQRFQVSFPQFSWSGNAKRVELHYKAE